jgi:hypothetical protein
VGGGEEKNFQPPQGIELRSSAAKILSAVMMERFNLGQTTCRWFER